MKPIDPNSQLFNFIVEFSDYSDYDRPKTTCQLIGGLTKSVVVCFLLYSFIIWATLYPILSVVGYVWFNYFHLGGGEVVEFGKGFFGAGTLIFMVELTLIVVAAIAALNHHYKITDRMFASAEADEYRQPSLVVQWLSDIHNKVCTKVAYTDDNTEEFNDSFKP